MPRRKKTEDPVASVEEVVESTTATTEEPVASAEEPTPADAAPVPLETTGTPAVVDRVIERMVQFSLGDRRFALPIDDVQEIQQIVELTVFPDTSPALLGMVNLRGAVVPVIDLRLLIGMERIPYTLDTPMIVCRSGGHLVALIVDEVEDVTLLPEGCLQPASKLYELADKLIGVCRMDTQLIFLIDLARLIPAEDLAAFVGLGEGA